jgi:hypothetical protein
MAAIGSASCRIIEVTCSANSPKSFFSTPLAVKEPLDVLSEVRRWNPRRRSHLREHVTL